MDTKNNENNKRWCYMLISKYYGDKRAKRSGVKYINHIDEGLQILDAINATQVAKDAYCLHPILQDDQTLQENISLIEHVDTKTVITAMEYRNVANRGLSCFQVDDPSTIYLGPLKDVHDMLIADKVQNRKDFLIYHFGTHPKSKELDRYFRNWLRALNVTEAQYDELVSIIDKREQNLSRVDTVGMPCFRCRGRGWLWYDDMTNQVGYDQQTLAVDDAGYTCTCPECGGSGKMYCDLTKGPCSCGAWH